MIAYVEHKEMKYFRMTPGFLAWVNTQKGHMPVGYPRGNAD